MIHAGRSVVLGCVGILLLSTGCKQQTGGESQAATEQTIRDVDEQWAKAAGAHNLDNTVSYYTDDAVLLPPNATIVSGKQALRTSWAALLSPNITLTWHANKVDVSQSGDLAYAVGAYDLSTKDAQGKLVSDHGKTIEVFRKQADGSWKVVADMYSSDLPAPAA